MNYYFYFKRKNIRDIIKFVYSGYSGYLSYEKDFKKCNTPLFSNYRS